MCSAVYLASRRFILASRRSPSVGGTNDSFIVHADWSSKLAAGFRREAFTFHVDPGENVLKRRGVQQVADFLL